MRVALWRAEQAKDVLKVRLAILGPSGKFVEGLVLEDAVVIRLHPAGTGHNPPIEVWFEASKVKRRTAKEHSEDVPKLVVE